MSNLSDEKLIKRATHAGRNLSVLAVLVSLVAMLFAGLGFVLPGAPKIFPLLAGSASLVAAAYWVLSVAARRGDPNSVGIVIIVMVVNLCVTFFSGGIAAARTGTSFHSHVPNVFVSLLILMALYQSRKILLELRERGLWDQAFPAAQPSGNLCILGGSLLVTGFLAMAICSGYLNSNVGQARTFEGVYANSFAEMIQQDEQAFLKSMHALSEEFSKAQLQETTDQLEGLETKLQLLKKQSAGSGQLEKILETYGGAVREWKNALALLKAPKLDTDQFTALIKRGDSLRLEACQAFDRQYAKGAAGAENP